MKNSPYLDRPLRSPAEAQWQREAAVAGRRMAELAKYGVTVVPPIALVKERDAAQRGIRVPE